MQRSVFALHSCRRGHKEAVASLTPRDLDGRVGQDELGQALGPRDLCVATPIVEGVTVGAAGTAGRVPRAEKFVWAVLATQTGSSYSDYRKFCEANSISCALASGDALDDTSREACRKISHATAVALVEDYQRLLRKGVRLALSQDDRDQVRVLRGRVVYVSPRVGWEDFTLGIVRDHGYEIGECVQATKDALQQFCTVESGRRTRNSLVGHEDTLDEALYDHARRITFCAATDGAEVEILAVQQLRKDGVFPNLRYQFRDRSHTTRTIAKGSFKHAKEGQRMREVLITGEHSFARRARNSRRFRRIWVQAQRESPDDLFTVLNSLAYAEQRFDSQSEPMGRLLLKLGPVLKTLIAMSTDC
jgi:hypothetical protein